MEINCALAICLYLKKYIFDEEFQNLIYEHLNDFQKFLGEDLYFEVLSKNFAVKEERISVETVLKKYILDNDKSLYESVHDAYVERLLVSDRRDSLINILKKKDCKQGEVFIDCSEINTQRELIRTIKSKLGYPQFCGDSWDAVDDLAYDVIFPHNLIFSNWKDMEKKLPEDAYILKSILDKNSAGRCVIIYA